MLVASPHERTRAEIESLGGAPGVVSLYGLENLTIIVWHGKPTVAAAEELARVSKRRRAEFPQGISAVHLVPATFELPDGPTRDTFVQLLRDGDGKLAVVCVVIRGAGFWVSAMRSLLTGLRVLSRGSVDLGLHTDLGAAIDYLLPRHHEKTSVPLAREQLTAVLTKLFDAKGPV